MSQETTFPQTFRPANRQVDISANRSVSQASVGSSTWTLSVRDMSFEADFIHELNGLASLSGGRNLFFESEFQLAAQNRVVPQSCRQMILSEQIGDENELRLYLPLHPANIGLAHRMYWRIASHPYAPLSLPLVDQSDCEEAFDRFAGLLGELEIPGSAPLVFEDFPIADRVGASMVNCLRRNGMLVALAGCHSRAILRPRNADESANQALRRFLPRKRLQEIRRQERKLAELGKLETETAVDFADIRLRFEEFLLLETRSWKGRRGTSLHTIRQTAAFARQTVASLALQRRSIIRSLRLDGRAVASMILLKSGNRYYPWKIAYDEAYRKFSPGKQLMLSMTRDLLERDEFQAADSLARENAWIDHMWPDRLELASLVVATNGTNTQRATKLAESLDRKTRWKRQARRWLSA